MDASRPPAAGPDDPSPPIDLTTLGWDEAWATAFAAVAAPGLVPARVAVEFNHIYRVCAERGEVLAQLSGRLRHTAGRREELPAVGDWVAVRLRDDEPAGTIEAILPRRSRFARKAAGDLTEAQVVAANIDTVFVVMGLDRDFNLRRLERYLVLTRESGAAPVVLLSKADLDAARAAAGLAEARAIAGPVPVHAVSAPMGMGLDLIRVALGRGRTGALLGSSGVGKSTIINALAGSVLMKTQPVRATDARGRHTTRHRQLIALGDDGLLIDTPGMRELHLWESSEALEETFDDVDALAVGCHFTDCRHVNEPRCAVKAAVDTGALSLARLEAYRKLHAERRVVEARREVRGRVTARGRARKGPQA